MVVIHRADVAALRKASSVEFLVEGEVSPVVRGHVVEVVVEIADVFLLPILRQRRELGVRAAADAQVPLVRRPLPPVPPLDQQPHRRAPRAALRRLRQRGGIYEQGADGSTRCPAAPLHAVGDPCRVLAQAVVVHPLVGVVVPDERVPGGRGVRGALLQRDLGVGSDADGAVQVRDRVDDLNDVAVRLADEGAAHGPKRVLERVQDELAVRAVGEGVLHGGTYHLNAALVACASNGLARSSPGTFSFLRGLLFFIFV